MHNTPLSTAVEWDQTSQHAIVQPAINKPKKETDKCPVCFFLLDWIFLITDSLYSVLHNGSSVTESSKEKIDNYHYFTF